MVRSIKAALHGKGFIAGPHVGLIWQGIMLVADVGITMYFHEMAVKEINKQHKINLSTWNTTDSKTGLAFGNLLNSAVQTLNFINYLAQFMPNSKIFNFFSGRQGWATGYQTMQQRQFLTEDPYSAQYRIQNVIEFFGGTNNWNQLYTSKIVSALNTGLNEHMSIITKNISNANRQLQSLLETTHKFFNKLNANQKLDDSEVLQLSITINKISDFGKDISDTLNGDCTSIVNKIINFLPENFNYSSDDEITVPNLVRPIATALVKLLSKSINNCYNIFKVDANNYITTLFNEFQQKATEDAEKKQIKQLLKNTKLPENLSIVFNDIRQYKENLF